MRLLLLLIAFTAGELAADPKSHYMIHCMGCHLADGSGQPPDVPVLDEQLGSLVASGVGRSYLIRVPGAAQAPLDDVELAGVINWMLDKYSRDTLPADFEPFTKEEVSHHRHHILSDPVRFKAEMIRGEHGAL